MADLTAEAAADDIGPFLARLLRLDPAALVRMRPAGSGRLTVWGRVPWGILVARTVPGPSAVDVTVSARELVDRLRAGRPGLPGRRDAQWRWPVVLCSSSQAEEDNSPAGWELIGGRKEDSHCCYCLSFCCWYWAPAVGTMAIAVGVMVAARA